MRTHKGRKDQPQGERGGNIAWEGAVQKRPDSGAMKNLGRNRLREVKGSMRWTVHPRKGREGGFAHEM